MMITKKSCLRVFAASLRVISAMTGNPPSAQFVKSQEFSNVRALQIFERKVLLSILNSRKIFERDLLSSDSIAKFATQKPWLFWDWAAQNFLISLSLLFFSDQSEVKHTGSFQEEAQSWTRLTLFLKISWLLPDVLRKLRWIPIGVRAIIQKSNISLIVPIILKVQDWNFASNLWLLFTTGRSRIISYKV